MTDTEKKKHTQDNMHTERHTERQTQNVEDRRTLWKTDGVED